MRPNPTYKNPSFSLRGPAYLCTTRSLVSRGRPISASPATSLATRSRTASNAIALHRSRASKICNAPSGFQGFRDSHTAPGLAAPVDYRALPGARKLGSQGRSSRNSSILEGGGRAITSQSGTYQGPPGVDRHRYYISTSPLRSGFQNLRSCVEMFVHSVLLFWLSPKVLYMTLHKQAFEPTRLPRSSVRSARRAKSVSELKARKR